MGVMTPDDEEWRPVVGYEETYEVSNLGRVRSHDRMVWDKRGFWRPKPACVLKPSLNRFTGYLHVGLSGGGRTVTRSIHRIVLETFVGLPPDPKMVCCHNDGNKQNNRADNLRWDTESNNQLDRNKHGKSMACRSHCKYGHEYTPENTVKHPSAPRSRICLTCQWIRNNHRSDLIGAPIDVRVEVFRRATAAIQSTREASLAHG